MSKKYYRGYGNFEMYEFVEKIHNGTLENHRRGLGRKDGDRRCPPYELLAKEVSCFYCQNCYDDCIAQVKEYKDYYKVKKKSYLKADFDAED